MRTLLLLTLMVLGLGGCASQPPPLCGGASIPYWKGPLVRPRTPVVRRYYQGDGGETSRKVSAAAAPVIAKVNESESEPRFTSSEWWSRENTRLGRVTRICNGCLAGSPVAAVSKPLNPLPPLPMLPNKHSELQGEAVLTLP